jgi:hypothetical protein
LFHVLLSPCQIKPARWCLISLRYLQSCNCLNNEAKCTLLYFHSFFFFYW